MTDGKRILPFGVKPTPTPTPPPTAPPGGLTIEIRVTTPGKDEPPK